MTVQWQGNPPKPAWNWWTPQAHELATQWRTTPCVVDWNQDGLNDLVMLDHEGYLAFFDTDIGDTGNWMFQPGQLAVSAGSPVPDVKAYLMGDVV